jgi:hypothetical protein
VSELEVSELEVPELEVAEISELESESLAVQTREPSAFEPSGELNRSVLPPLPPLRHHGTGALRTLHHDQADLALASLPIAERTSAVRHIAADIEPASAEVTELDKQVGRRDLAAIASRKERSDLDETAKTITLSQAPLVEDADVSAPLRRLQSAHVKPAAPAILRDRSVISDSPLNPASVAELRPTDDASRRKPETKDVRIVHSREKNVSVEEFQRIETVIHQLFPGSRIECHREPTRLIVRGVAQNERQAVEIISTIRRSQLIPVIDLIETRAPDRRIQMP